MMKTRIEPMKNDENYNENDESPLAADPLTDILKH